MEHHRQYLLLASYCADNPKCSESRPCKECLGMCNIFDENLKYIGEYRQTSLTKTGKVVKCGTCGGLGELSRPPYTDSEVCPECNGKGVG